jgi:maltose alpha-D-glucosyltransferase/alpha-amylase
MRFDSTTAYITLMEVEYREGEAETYVIPLTTAPVEHEAGIIDKYAHAVVAYLKSRGKNDKSLLYDAMVNTDFTTSLLNAIQRRRTFKSVTGEIIASPTSFLTRDIAPTLKDPAPSPMKVEQSNTSISYGDQLILKLFRKLEDGISPDVEIGNFLTEKTSFTNIARVAGSLEYQSGRNQPVSLAILQGYVPHESDAWQYTLDSLERYFETVLAHPTVQSPPVPHKPLLSLPEELPSLARDTIGMYLASSQLLGQRTAEMHVALASEPANPDFAPVPYTLMYQISLYQSLRGFAMRTFQLLRENLPSLPEDSRQDARSVLDMEKTIIDRYNLIRREKITASRIRCHGDYHLGQILHTGKDFVITDFEGEPARSLSERRIKRSPLRDVAGMIRSFDYAARTALAKQVALQQKSENIPSSLNQWAQYWYIWVSVVFLNTYLDITRPAGLAPEDPGQLKILLDAFLLEKALYEVNYELNNRPDWVGVPLQGILETLESEG